MPNSTGRSRTTKKKTNNSNLHLPLYAEIPGRLEHMDYKISLMKEAEWENICVPVTDMEWMVSTIRTLQHHVNSLMNQEKYDQFKIAELIRVQDIKDNQMKIMKTGLNYITGMNPINEEAIVFAQKILDKALQLPYYDGDDD